jgi:hypothetical protein
VSKQYFATLATDQLVKECAEKIKIFDQHLEKTGIARRLAKSEALYYGKHMGEANAGSSEVASVGLDGEMSAFGVNVYRNLIQHRMALTTSQKLSYDPRAINSDTDSLQQTRLARGVLDYYETEKRLRDKKAGAAERALVGAVGYVWMGWDRRKGRPVGVKPAQNAAGEQIEKVIYEGDVFAKAKSLPEVIYDVDLREWSDKKWLIIEDLENKWDLCEAHPEKRDEILKLTQEESLRSELSLYKRSRYQDRENSGDLIPTYTLLHLKTDSVPSGRMTKFLSNLTSLEDAPIPYQDKFESELGVIRISAGEDFSSVFGYSDSFDAITLQQVLNVLLSTVFTNQQAFGVQMVSIPAGSEISPSHIGPMVYLRTPPGTEAKGINLTNTPAEIFKGIDMFKQLMTELQGLNSVVTGDPDHNLKSGAALGRLQAMAIQFASNFQRQWAQLNEEAGTFLLKLLKWFAKSERMVAIAGKRNKLAMDSFTGGDLALIDRVVVDLGNPLMYTAAGKSEEADKLLKDGNITLQQYFEIRDTGSTEPMTEDAASEEELMQKENECLMEGTPVKAMVGDAHKAHLKRHKGLRNDPHLRSRAAAGDPKALAVIEAALAHEQEHINLELTQDIVWFAVSGEQPPPPPPMPVGPDGKPLPPVPPQGGPQGPQDLPPPPEAPPIPPPVDAA